MINWFEKNLRISLVVLILISVFIFWISSMSFSASSGGFGWKTVVYHFVVFFGFELFLLICLVGGRRRRFLIFGVVMGVLYGISDELHQFLVPGRCCSLGDVFVDSLGVFCAFLFYGIVLERRGFRGNL